MFIGRYEVIGDLGEGGMGTVHLARDPMTGREVAVKTIRGTFSADARARFQREVQAVAKLQHPNIVTVFDVGDHHGVPFMVLERIRGLTLKQLIDAEPPLPIDRALDYVSQLCLGLAHAHRESIVHRDVKPGNLMVDADDRLRILDFGVARIADASEAMASIVAGTPAYMSPEQLRGEAPDGRSDLFAAGAVLYELLARRPAFKRGDESSAAVMHRVLHGTPDPVRTWRPDVSVAVEQIVSTALAKSRESRYADAHAMRQAIEAARTEDTTGSGGTTVNPDPVSAETVAATPAWKRAAIAAAVLVAVGSAAAGSVTLWRQLDVAAAEGPEQPAGQPTATPTPKARDLFYAPAPKKSTAAPVAGAAASTRGRAEAHTGLKYRLQRQQASGSWSDVDPAHVFRSGDKVRLGFQANVESYLYVLVQGSTGRWRQIFPDDRIDAGRNVIRPFEDYLVPAEGAFVFDANPGEERLFVYLSATPLSDLRGYGAPATAVAAIDDAAVTRLGQNIRSRDLVFEAPAARPVPTSADSRRDVIVVNTAEHGGPVVLSLTLTHK